MQLACNALIPYALELVDLIGHVTIVPPLAPQLTLVAAGEMVGALASLVTSTSAHVSNTVP